MAALAGPATATAASPGAPGLGDRLAPGLGNGGYDVLHYDLDLRYATSAPSQSIDGTVTILAQATQSLSRFNLDFGGQSVGGVPDGGLPARRRGFPNAWVYGETTPPMPGDPDWTVDPAEEGVTAKALARSPARRR